MRYLCGAETYTWDARNRLVGFNGFTADCSPLTASFKYDALGRRIEKTINGVTTQYVYDGWDITQEIQGGLATNYIRTLNIDEPLMRIMADGTIRHYKTDALGSVIGLADDTGALKTTYAYDPFGSVAISGESSDNPFQFVGRENDGTGLLYERNRYYSFELQRYISEDPIGFAGGDVNFYVRVGNNPVNFTDPLGLYLRDDLIKEIIKHVPSMEKQIVALSKYLNEGALYSILKDLEARELARKAALRQAGRIGLGTVGIILGDLIFPEEVGGDDTKMIEDWLRKREKCK